MSGPKIERGISPEGSISSEGCENQGITREELLVFVPDYHTLIHERLYERGILKEGDQLELTFPAFSHPNSQAEYLFDGIIGDDWVFVVFMRPNKKTSKHKHPNEEIGVEEDCELLAGKMFLHLGEDESSRAELTEAYSFATIPPDTFHRNTTDGHFALYIARTRGAAPIPRDKLHIPF